MRPARLLLPCSLLLLFTLAAVVGACGRDDAYSQQTPDDVLKSALAMVRAGDASLLPRLIDDGGSKDMRAVLNRLGRLTGSLQDLAKTVAARFPDDVAKLKQQVTEEAQGDKGKQAMDFLTKGPQAALKSPKGPPSPEEQQKQREAIEGTFARLMADPFSFLEQSAGKLTTAKISDDQAAVMYDNMPVPPVGLTMRMRDGKWYIELPLNLPFIRDYVPQTHTEHQIIASLIKVFDNTVKDLTNDLKSGKVASVNQLSEKAGERAFVPAGMVVLVYAKEMETRRQREKALRDFGKRLSEWVTARPEQPEVGRKLADLLTRVAVEELDKAVRARIKDEKNKVPKFEGMAEPDFVSTLQTWLNGRKVSLSLAAAINPGDLEKAAAQVAESLGQIAKARKK